MRNHFSFSCLQNVGAQTKKKQNRESNCELGMPVWKAQNYSVLRNIPGAGGWVCCTLCSGWRKAAGAPGKQLWVSFYTSVLFNSYTILISSLQHSEFGEFLVRVFCRFTGSYIASSSLVVELQIASMDFKNLIWSLVDLSVLDMLCLMLLIPL